MQEGEPRNTLEKRYDRRTRVEALLIRPPRLKRAAGHIKHFGRLTLGDTLGLESAIRLKQVSAFEAIPALVAITIATLCVMDYSAHSYLLPKLMPCEKWMAKAGEVATALQARAVLIAWGRHLSQVADAVIEAVVRFHNSRRVTPHAV